MAGAIYCVLLHAGGLLQCLYSCSYRRKLRAAYGLPAEPCGDGCVHCFCEPCALAQMYRELKNRGTDPADGKRPTSAFSFVHPSSHMLIIICFSQFTNHKYYKLL
jgi:hypothetical protein